MKTHRAQLAMLATVSAALAFAPVADARKQTPSLRGEPVAAYEDNRAVSIPASGSLEVAFSPNEGSEALIIKVIDSARSELRVLAYSFTSARITAALLRAKKRGVDVRVVADQKSNTVEDRSGKARAALSALVNAGVDVRLIGAYPSQHDKMIIADRQTVEIGSTNYSDAAARKNSETTLVNWNNAKLAYACLEHFDRNYRQAVAYKLGY